MKPPKRERRMRIINGAEADRSVPCGEKWTLQEKKLLLDGLKSYGPKNLERLQKEFLPARKAVDIQNFITTLKMRFKNRKPRQPVSRAPIEVWLDEAEELTKKENDFSFVLADVFSVFANLEPHDILPDIHALDWGEIYLFLAALLRGANTPSLSPINAMIVLSLFDELAEDLSLMDSKVQQQLMRQKYSILRQAAKASNKTLAYCWAQTALEKDPFERIQQKQSSSQQPTGTVTESVGTCHSTIIRQGSPIPMSDTNHSTHAEVRGEEVTCSLTSVMQSTVTSAEGKSSSGTVQMEVSSKMNKDDDSGARIMVPVRHNDNNATSHNQKEKSSISTNQNKVLDSLPKQVSSLYTLNPFCIPVKYLNMSVPNT